MLPSGIPTLQHYNSSIVSTQVVRALRTATILIDMDAVHGMRLEAISAYASLVALAEIRSGSNAPRSSILSIFDGPDEFTTISEWDAAFLVALYRLPLDREARHQRNFLTNEIASSGHDSRRTSTSRQ